MASNWRPADGFIEDRDASRFTRRASDWQGVIDKLTLIEEKLNILLRQNVTGSRVPDNQPPLDVAS